MLLCEWKVKGIIAAVFIIDYRPKGWIPARITGCLTTGRMLAPLEAENQLSCACIFHRVIHPVIFSARAGKTFVQVTTIEVAVIMC